MTRGPARVASGPAGMASGRAGVASGRAGVASGPAGVASGPAGVASGPAGMASGPAAAPPDPPRVTVRYWASARAASGVDSEQLPGRTVGEVLAVAATAHAGLASVLAVASILLDGRTATGSDSVLAGATLEVLPPFAGG